MHAINIVIIIIKYVDELDLSTDVFVQIDSKVMLQTVVCL